MDNVTPIGIKHKQATDEFKVMLTESFPLTVNTKIFNLIVHYHNTYPQFEFDKTFALLEEAPGVKELSGQEQVDLLSRVFLSFIIGYANGCLSGDPFNESGDLQRFIDGLIDAIIKVPCDV